MASIVTAFSPFQRQDTNGAATPVDKQYNNTPILQPGAKKRKPEGATLAARINQDAQTVSLFDILLNSCCFPNNFFVLCRFDTFLAQK